MQSCILGAKEIDGPHTGENLANIMKQVLIRYGLQHKVRWSKVGTLFVGALLQLIFAQIFCITTDNASNNVTMGSALEKDLDLTFKKRNMIPCFAHVLNLACKSVYETLTGLKQDKDATIEDLTHMTENEFETLADVGIIDFIPNISNTIKKIRKLAVDVSRSPQRMCTFREHCKRNNQDTKSLLHDTPTRWNSTYFMLERASNVKIVVQYNVEWIWVWYNI